MVNGDFDILKGFPLGDFKRQLILHMIKETFLRCIVPAVASAGHRLAQIKVFYQLNEADAYVVGSLVAVNNRFFVK